MIKDLKPLRDRVLSQINKQKHAMRTKMKKKLKKI